MSLLLCALAVGTLLVYLRSSTTFKGITQWHSEFKLSLHADDLLMYVSDRKFQYHVQKISFWSKSIDLQWYRLEARSCVSSSLAVLVSSTIPTSGFTNNLVVSFTPKIWFQFWRHCKFYFFIIF